MARQLGEFLRQLRQRTGGASVRGLRRQDVAARAGISTSYYTQLEQGRRHHPSRRVLEAVAVALGLDPARRDELVAFSSDGVTRPPAPAHVDPALGRALDALEHVPAAVLDGGLGVLRANERWRGLHAGFTGSANLADMVFLDPAARGFFLDWHHAADVVLTLLAAQDGAEDAAAGQRVQQLLTDSPAFARRWLSAAPTGHYRPTRLRVRHQALGPLTYRHDVFLSDQHPRPRLHVLFPTDDETTALTRLADLYRPRGTEGTQPPPRR